MTMWLTIMIAALLLTGSSFAYLASRISKFAFVKNLAKENRRKKRAIGAAFALGTFLFITIIWKLPNAFVCALYFSFAWLISDFIFFILKKTGLHASDSYYAGGLAVIIAISSLGTGWHLAHNVWRAEYNLTTDKKTEPLKIVMFADSHTGTTFNAEGFAKHAAAMQAENPDLIVVAGDFVDDDTSREDMVETSRILGQMRTKYGIFFVFGNHDPGYFGSERRGFSGQDLINELEKNGVKVLRDEVLPAGDDFYVAGRLDYSVEREQNGTRKNMEQLLRDADRKKYIIVADHQPADFARQAESAADLVLSGHTHGGQLFPFNNVGKWIGANDRVYGYERRNRTDFIVTSGISDWAIKFKTGTKSEYVVINLLPSK